MSKILGFSRATSSAMPAGSHQWFMVSPLAVSSPSSFHPTTPSPSSVSHVSLAEAAGIIAILKDKRCSLSLKNLLKLKIDKSWMVSVKDRWRGSRG